MDLSFTLRIRQPRYFELGALFGRIERLEARHKRYAPDAVVAAPRALDVDLLQRGDAFEQAWADEVSALIAERRAASRQARLAVRRARARTARIAAQIEASRAASLAGLAVKSRVILWRRNGEPLGRQPPTAARQ